MRTQYFVFSFKKDSTLETQKLMYLFCFNGHNSRLLETEIVSHSLIVMNVIMQKLIAVVKELKNFQSKSIADFFSEDIGY